MKTFIIPNLEYRLRYHDLPGTETPIIFIHGLGCAGSFDYPNLATQEPLITHRRILIDLLGNGYSDKPEDFSYSVQDHANYLFELIQYLNLKKFILFGHSIGGSVALSLAQLCEERIEAVILGEANLDAGGGFISRAIAAYSYEDFVSHGFNTILETNRHNGNELWAASFSVCAPKAVYVTSKSAIQGQTPSWREIFYDLTCPKSFIIGEHSLPEQDELNALQQHDIKVEILKNTSHSMTWENPEGLAQAIKNTISI